MFYLKCSDFIVVYNFKLAKAEVNATAFSISNQPELQELLLEPTFLGFLSH